MHRDSGEGSHASRRVSRRSASHEADDEVAAAAALMNQWRRTTWARRVALVWRSRRGIAEAVRAVRALPVLDLSLEDSPHARELARLVLRRRQLRVRNGVAAGVLELPVCRPAAYLEGRPRQALRTNSTHAIRSGITCRRVAGDGMPAVVADIIRLRPGADDFERSELTRIATDGDSSMWAAENADGSPIAILVVTIASDTAFLSWMVSADADERSAARYLLSGHVYVELARCGIRHLITDSILETSPGNIYFQQRLGFVPKQVRVRLT